ncbi:MAG: 1-aminocyclopropane-1-carboxylate deaminase/D-cysteine desulfhydrase [Saprospiraceae bacterium]|nr:1-aminocyclopropane-1-carboxylate deaminase/D-cysteine desulfhydrase [Saprospiraceae bacterium]MCB0623201.1 1-aminocyclopropane-1-carboxylate deaminase/D-cysteine desulfhydrase [Saprospiraceae bacterium]MCB0676955.1 1-aminocyclopropane-1-carboxylate deaminase/D-cysteine desulfhydrase [Saprospiraceae bacterium]MCB0681290.1 1-aminocyclopropane-1-carboxylate deaminase/D-cysteine desulfhydrase [Saprospiraceae bacterium]
MLDRFLPTPIHEPPLPSLAEQGLRLLVKRDDLIHPDISGNKWRKLKYNLLELQEQEIQRLLTFGGAYSNHIAAVAAAGQTFGFDTIGIIRGERVDPLNPTLRQAQKAGMHLEFVSRIDYRRRYDPDYQEHWRQRFGNCYLLPEGGTNALALKGCAELIDELEQDLPEWPDYICVSAGTGGTMAGLVAGLRGRSKVLGFSALKGDFLAEEVRQLLERTGCGEYANWQMIDRYHFGGYAQYHPEVVRFVNAFKLQTGIPLEPIYTGKMFCGIFDLAARDFFRPGQTILAIHTGGLQGIRGFNERHGKVIE